MLRLITIPISHYCEKARWALDRAGMEYREERHVQGIHRLAARRAGGGITVPVLVTEDGAAIGESAQIIEWVDERLAPDQRLLPADVPQRTQVDGLCRHLDEQFGPAGRRLMYVHMLAQPEQMLAFNNQGVPRWEDRAARWGWPLMVRVVGRALGIAPGVDVLDEATVWRELDYVAGLLEDGRPYLCGERFGAADLTFASLAAPVIVPSIYGVPLPALETLPSATAVLVQRARDHPAGRFADRMISQERRLAGVDVSPIPAPATA